MHRLLLAGAIVLSLGACQRQASEAKSPVVEDVALTGWLDADGAGETGLVYRDSPDEPGFSMSCRQTDKSFHLEAPAPTEDAPIANETATLILGDEAFITPVATGEGDMLVVETPAVPQLLRAIADAKSARLVFRDGFVETGVDTEGKMLAFSKNCETLTGVSAGP